MPETASLLSKTDEFLIGAAKIWKGMKEAKDASEPFSKAKDAFEIANRAATGDLSAYDPNIEKVRVYVSNQKDKLADLARKDENYWMDISGANVLNPLAMVKARTNVDEWTKNFSNLRILIQQLLPMVQQARAIFSNTAVSSVRSAIDESSLPPLDGIALGQVVGDMNNSLMSLDTILRCLRNCRLAMR
jgi:hypothetical protein